MAQYIDKSVLVAEIEKCYNICLERAKVIAASYWEAKADAYRNVLVILDNTLEVKDVDLEEEKDSYVKIHKDIFTSVCQTILDGADDDD